MAVLALSKETEADALSFTEYSLTGSDISDSGACGNDKERQGSTQNPLPESKHSTQLFAFFKRFATTDIILYKPIKLLILES